MTDETVYKGNIVAVTLKRDAAPMRCHVGEVQAVGERGLRITKMDWIVGRSTGLDVFMPWSQVTSIKVATEEHSLDKGGIDSFGQWQTEMNKMVAKTKDDLPADLSKPSEK